jgi:hypothetical protein
MDASLARPVRRGYHALRQLQEDAASIAHVY